MKNKFALIGFTGFIGSNLVKFRKSIDKYNSKNISSIKHNNYEIVICAGTSSKRWLANKFPKKDKKKILNLIKYLDKINVRKFVLISTCEVFGNNKNSNEKSKLNFSNKSEYAKNRIYLENFCKKRFKNILIIRLPIVYGKNFSKNFIFDLLNKKEIHKLNGRDKVQIYNVKNLVKHINYAIKENIKFLNISPPPIQMSFIAKRFFNINLGKYSSFRNMDMRTIHAKKKSNYFMSKLQTLKDLSTFIKK